MSTNAIADDRSKPLENKPDAPASRMYWLERGPFSKILWNNDMNGTPPEKFILANSVISKPANMSAFSEVIDAIHQLGF